ncbi:MAG: HI0074 family nucleotidyltransferase substrate-binding subunit [Candidatus Omnitrophota bacterium]|nr:HI0074 family nucleotidyltransferase substrate-binding subunit [Candidatus Omnitrophota bacterium]
MERLRQRLEVGSSALASLKELLKQPPASLVERDAAIQRFEYTVEAIWKAAQRYLDIREGLSAGSPKAAVRMCREVGLLDDEQATQALEMMDDRNLTVHTYNERIAQQIYANLPRYASLLEQWRDRMKARFDKGT